MTRRQRRTAIRADDKVCGPPYKVKAGTFFDGHFLVDSINNCPGVPPSLDKDSLAVSRCVNVKEALMTKRRGTFASEGDDAGATDGACTGLRVLVVDDSEINRIFAITDFHDELWVRAVAVAEPDIETLLRSREDPST